MQFDKNGENFCYENYRFTVYNGNPDVHQAINTLVQTLAVISLRFRNIQQIQGIVVLHTFQLQQDDRNVCGVK